MLVEALLGLRGVVLAAILGPELFGVWAIFRVIMRYCGSAGLGMLRGLELEASAPRAAGGMGPETARAESAGTALAFLLLVFGPLSLVAAGVAGLRLDDWLAPALAGVAGSLVFDRLWSYGTTYLRATSDLWRLALYELINAALQITLVVALAYLWGLKGALLGFVLANAAALLFLLGRVPMRPSLSLPRLRSLLNTGFPVGLTFLLATSLATIDRVAVAAFGGAGLLGYYAFAVALSKSRGRGGPRAPYAGLSGSVSRCPSPGRPVSDRPPSARDPHAIHLGFLADSRRACPGPRSGRALLRAGVRQRHPGGAHLPVHGRGRGARQSRRPRRHRRGPAVAAAAPHGRRPRPQPGARHRRPGRRSRARGPRGRHFAGPDHLRLQHRHRGGTRFRTDRLAGASGANSAAVGMVRRRGGRPRPPGAGRRRARCGRRLRRLSARPVAARAVRTRRAAGASPLGAIRGRTCLTPPLESAFAGSQRRTVVVGRALGQGLVEIAEKFGHRAPRHRQRERARLLPVGHEQLTVGQIAFDRLLDRVRGPGLDHEAVAPNEIARPARRRDQRETRGHGLEHRVWHRIAHRRQDENRSLAIAFGEGDAVEVTQERHPSGNSKAPTQLVQSTPLGAVAGYGEGDVGVLASEIAERPQEKVDPFSLDQPAHEQEIDGGAAGTRPEQPGVNAIRDHFDPGFGCGLERKRAQAVADGNDAGRRPPHASGEMPEQERVQPAQPLTVTGDIGAAQRDHVGEPLAERETDQAGRPAAPAMADIEALRGDQTARIGVGAHRPFCELGRAPEMVSALADRDPVNPDCRRRPHDLEASSRPAGDKVGLEVGELRKLVQQLRAGQPGPAAERRVLVVDHQDPEWHLFTRADPPAARSPPGSNLRPCLMCALDVGRGRPYPQARPMAIAICLFKSRRACVGAISPGPPARRRSPQSWDPASRARPSGSAHSECPARCRRKCRSRPCGPAAQARCARDAECSGP